MHRGQKTRSIPLTGSIFQPAKSASSRERPCALRVTPSITAAWKVLASPQVSQRTRQVIAKSMLIRGHPLARRLLRLALLATHSASFRLVLAGWHYRAHPCSHEQLGQYHREREHRKHDHIQNTRTSTSILRAYPLRPLSQLRSSHSLSSGIALGSTGTYVQLSHVYRVTMHAGRVYFSGFSNHARHLTVCNSQDNHLMSPDHMSVSSPTLRSKSQVPVGTPSNASLASAVRPGLMLASRWNSVVPVPIVH